MQTGYFQPLTGRYQLGWIWWGIFVSFRQVIYYENNMSAGFILNTWLILAIAFFYFLIHPRKFFASKRHLSFGMSVDLSCITTVRLTHCTFEFVYEGKPYRFIIIGKSNRLLRGILKETENDFRVTG